MKTALTPTRSGCKIPLKGDSPMLRKSKRLLRKALEVIPGGVNSPVRAFKAVGGTPPFIVRASGSKLYDADGNCYIDYVCSWGPLILGHADKDVVSAVREIAKRGTSYGAPTPAEVELAELITRSFPSIEMVRLVNSGTEAVMSALRLARAYTGRSVVVKFEGCYHGHSDGLLAKAGSGTLTFALPDSAGVPLEFTRTTAVLPYNDSCAVERFIKKHGDRVSAILVEPIAGNMGVVPPVEGFLRTLRRLCDECGAVLIFDEIITGFRVARGGAQELYGVRGDLTTLGKIIGGGLPIGAYGGKKKIMKLLAPEGPVYQAGTLSGNPVAVSAGLVTLKKLRSPGVYRKLERLGCALEEGLLNSAKETGVELWINRVGSMMTLFFSEKPVTDYASAKSSRTGLYRVFFHEMLKRGIYLPPSPFEAMFLSSAHRDTDIARTVRSAREAFNRLAPRTELHNSTREGG